MSDAERHAVVEVLRRGYGEGRLDLAEFEERTAAALAARVRSDLEPLTADLPPTPPDRAPPSTVAPRPTPARSSPPGAVSPPVRSAARWVVAVMGGAERRGRWRPDEETNAVAVMGGIDLDLREAVLEGPEVVINAVAIMGGIDVVVPEGVPVELTGFALMGAKDAKVADVAPIPGAPLVRVRAFALMGGVSVRSKRPEEPKKARGRKHLGGRRELGGPEDR